MTAPHRIIETPVYLFDQLSDAFDMSIDWPAFESAVAEAIADKEGA